MKGSLDRRTFLSLTGKGLAALAAAAWVADARAADPPQHVKRCVLVWLNGGPSHIDTFDPKPGKATGGPFRAIHTSAPGVLVSEHLPQLATQAHRIAICRGMTTKEGNHQRARYLVHTGYAPNPTVEHPSLGAYVSEELGDGAFALPNFVSLGGPSIGPGFLGLAHGPFVVQEVGRLPQNVAPPANVDDARFERRKAALERLESRFAAESGDDRVAQRRAVYDRAARMMASNARRAFEIEDEPEAVVRAYGDTDFGRRCLMARRLLEQGVRFVEVALDGWDTHKDNFDKTKKLMTTLDPALATLLRELASRKMLDSTLVLCMGEFGRTPKINVNDGRDHHPQAWTALLAGAGIRGGIAYGKTDDEGAKVVESPVSIPDLMATAMHALGIDPAKTFSTPLGRPIATTDNGSVVRGLLMK